MQAKEQFVQQEQSQDFDEFFALSFSSLPDSSSSSSFPPPEEDDDSLLYATWLHRFLAAAASDDDEAASKINYGVLSVVVMTLGLIMVVEVCRHRLDVAALGRPFFKAVLEGVYTELSTLGMVELLIWLLHSYYANLDTKKEAVFAKVHFTLFYTAILTAFQTVLCAFFANRVGMAWWVRTEALELNHYVEIREEFQRVSEQLQAVNRNNRNKEQQQGSKRRFRVLTKHNNDNKGHSSDANANAAPDLDVLEGGDSGDVVADESALSSGAMIPTKKPMPITTRQSSIGSNRSNNSNLHHQHRRDIGPYDDLFERQDHDSQNCCVHVCISLHLFGRGLLDRIRYPHLKRKYNQLLIQVRFHELRVYFLQAYQLPLKLKISDYLLRSQLTVLIRLVHVSMVAWLWLTSATNLLYFLLGIVSYETQNPEVVGVALEVIFFGSMGGFLIIAIALHEKMKLIFKKIIYQEVLWDTDQSESEKKQLAEQQLALFWFSDPNLVIAAIQFMQFCYAISLSVVIIFWEQISEGSISMLYYFLAIAISYSVFVFVVAKVIPQYTLCTSLGQLVDEKQLHETLSIFHLKEAKLGHLEDDHHKMDLNNTLVAVSGGQVSSGTATTATSTTSTVVEPTAAAGDVQPPLPSPGSFVQGLDSAFSSVSAGPTFAGPTTVGVSRKSTASSGKLDATTSSAEIMASLVRLDTGALRSKLPDKEREALQSREGRDRRIQERRRNRQKSVSDGVATMTRLAMAPVGAFAGLGPLPTHTRDDSLVGGIRKMSPSLFDTGRQVAMPPPSPVELNPDDTRLENLRERRRKRGRRTKSVSDGVALMAMLGGEPVTKAQTPEPEAHYSQNSTGDSEFSLMARKWMTGDLNPAVPTRRKHFRKSVSDGVKALTGRTQDDSVVGGVMNVPFPMAHMGASVDLKPDDTAPENLRARRRTRGRRQKSVSDGVALMRSLLAGDIMSEPIHEEKAIEETGLVRTSTVGSVAGGPSSASLGTLSIVSDVPPPISSEINVTSIIRPITLQATVHAAAPAAASPACEYDSGSERAEDPSESEYVTDSLRSFVDEAKKTLRDRKREFLLGAGGALSRGSPDSTSEHPVHSRPGSNDGHEKDDDQTSIRSTESVDGLSDIDDIPDVDPLHYVVAADKRPTPRQVLRSYYLSRRFALVSNVFGTMVAFFMVGQRVEGFLEADYITDLSVFVTFAFPTSASFWVLFVWFILFLVTSSLIFYSLGPFPGLTTNRERATFFGAIMDGLLTLVCLVFLCVAEVQRCCHSSNEYAGNGSYRFLAEEYDTQSDDGSTYAAQPDSNLCSCPSFGSRYYGGYGKIEPFTSLIALRLLRHWAAKRLAFTLESSFVKAKDDLEFRAKERTEADPFAVFGDQHKESSNMSEEKGTIIELWETAVGRYPDIVAKYGDFSGELLKAMLGVPIPGGSPEHVESPETNATESRPVDGSQPFSLENQYATLSPHAQEFIMAGRLGRTVKYRKNQRHDPTESMHPAIPEDEEACFGAEHGHRPNLHIAIDVERPHSNSMLAFPNALLVRSMRRCDRKLLPFLDKWAVVDVVFTKHEIVYFDCMDDDDDDEASINSSMEGMKQALIATKGGKGLRLCDVAAGRRVVGQLPLSDIVSIHVEREMPHVVRPGVDVGPAAEVNQTEYWHKKRAADQTLDKEIRWCTIKQDVLKARTVTGNTLCLRFYSDLQDAEAHPDRLLAENATEGPLHKDNALQWVQTIVRYCGPEQLKQPLPHFGDDTCEELRDFLLVNHDDTKESRPRLRRVVSDSGGDQGVFHYFQHALPRRTEATPDTSVPTTSIKRPHRIGLHRSRSIDYDSDPPSKSRHLRKRSFHFLGEFASEEITGNSLSTLIEKETGNENNMAASEEGDMRPSDFISSSAVRSGEESRNEGKEAGHSIDDDPRLLDVEASGAAVRRGGEDVKNGGVRFSI